MNCQGLAYIASAGLGAIMGAIEEVRENGGDIRLSELNETVRNIFEILGFTHLYKHLSHGDGGHLELPAGGSRAPEDGVSAHAARTRAEARSAERDLVPGARARRGPPHGRGGRLRGEGGGPGRPRGGRGGHERARARLRRGDRSRRSEWTWTTPAPTSAWSIVDDGADWSTREACRRST